MVGPSWLAVLLAAVMLATAVYCASRLVAAWRWRRPTEYDVDGGHMFMGVAMAGMLVPRLDVFPRGGWEVIFGVAAAWFGARAVDGYLRQKGRRSAEYHVGHDAHHLLGCGAMLYMLLVVYAGSGGVPGMSMAGPADAPTASPVLALGLALALVVGVLWAAERLVSPAPGGAPGRLVTAGTQAEVSGIPAAGLESRAAKSSGNPVAGPGGSRSAALTANPAALSAIGAAGRPAIAGGRPPMSPRLAACCEILMGLTMGYMLIMLV